MTNPQNAILYLRSSKDRSDVSIDAQRRALHDLAVARGLVVVDEFADAVESGKDEDRPGWLRLIAELKAPARTWLTVLALDTARVARRRLISMMFEADCTKRGVRVVYKSLPDADPATEMVLKSVLQAFDEYHSLVSRAKGLAGMAENVRQGWRAGGRAPRGYRLEYHGTGAIRDGAPVMKSKLVLCEETSPVVQAYLSLRAQGVPRGTAVARLALPWPPSSTQSMDWQALTYAGHTVWGMHAEREGGAAMGGEKRRPRSEWQVQRNTHPPLISEAEAEAILGQLEEATQGRRLRSSPLLLTGLLMTPEGLPWHSDGCGSYRVGKGRKIAASRIETAALGQLAVDLQSDHTVGLLCTEMQALASEGEPIDGRRVAGMEKRAETLAAQISKTVDLAAQMDDPAPVLRRVSDLESQRAQLLAEVADLKARQAIVTSAAAISEAEVRALLRRLLDELSATTCDADLRDQARLALREIVERIELDDKGKTPALCLHYAVSTGVNLASPRESVISPVIRWASSPVSLARKRA